MRQSAVLQCFDPRLQLRVEDPLLDQPLRLVRLSKTRGRVLRRVPLSIGLTGADALTYVGGSTAKAVGKRQTAEDQRQRIARVGLTAAVVVHREQQQQQKVGIHLILQNS